MTLSERPSRAANALVLPAPELEHASPTDPTDSLGPRGPLPRSGKPGLRPLRFRVVGQGSETTVESDPERWEPIGLYATFGKRAVNLLLLLVVAPATLAIAAPIALVNLVLFRRPSKVLFHQSRVGRNGRIFRIWKFRTMRHVPKEEHFDSWRNGDDHLRVTAFGRILRNTHLDELPQILNVLAGDMDFVGPRPEMLEIHEWACSVIPGFENRLAVRPGITGRAQITQGYAMMDESAYAAKLEADLEYADDLSLWNDLSIVLRTFLWMLGGKGWSQFGLTAHDHRGWRDKIKPWPQPVSSRTPASPSTTQAPVIPNGQLD